MQTLRDFLIVGVGSFFGGGLRFLVSRLASSLVSTPFPLGTFVVNVVGCLLIGFVSALPLGGLSPQTKLFLTTGFCGGFTTFSTFMGESAALAGGHDHLLFFSYLVGSFAVGLLCVWAGNALARAM